MQSEDERAQDDEKASSSSNKAKRMVYPLSTQAQNVGDVERLGSTLVGVFLLLTGLNRRSLASTLGAVVGGLLIARGVSGHSRFYQWFGLNTAGTEPPRNNGERAPDAPKARPSAPAKPVDPTLAVASITVGRDAAELYDLWLLPETTAQTHRNFAQVEGGEEGELKWKVPLPLNKSLDWETRIVQSVPGERIRWASSDGAIVHNTSEVSFRPAPGGRGTEVTLHLQIGTPGGKVGGAAAAKLFGLAPSAVVNKALRNFKALVETGEIPTLENNVSARGVGDSF